MLVKQRLYWWFRIVTAKEYLEDFKEALGKIDLGDMDMIVDTIFTAYANNKIIVIMGNGGSAAIASHFVCDLSKNTIGMRDEKRFKVISLTDNVPLITAYSNDYDYEHVFSQQLKNWVGPGDVVIAISSSGNSKNVINAINMAKEHKAITIGFVGFDGGLLKGIVDYKLWVKKNDYGMVEDSHSAIQHALCYIIKEKLNQS